MKYVDSLSRKSVFMLSLIFLIVVVQSTPLLELRFLSRYSTCFLLPWVPGIWADGPV